MASIQTTSPSEHRRPTPPADPPRDAADRRGLAAECGGGAHEAPWEQLSSPTFWMECSSLSLVGGEVAGQWRGCGGRTMSCFPFFDRTVKDVSETLNLIIRRGTTSYN